MGTVLLVLVVVLVIAGLVYGVVTLLAGEDPGMSPTDPDGRARPLPNNRSLTELDLKTVRFDVGIRGYRMTQVDRVLRRTAYDIGYKDEMIAVLEAEVIALREGRAEDAELLRKAREAAAAPPAPPGAPAGRVAAGAHRVGESDDTLVHEDAEEMADDADAEGSSPSDAEGSPRADADGRSASSRADAEGRSASSRADAEGRSASSRADADGRSASSRAGEPGEEDPTAPGLLNRAALRRVTDADSPAEASGDEGDAASEDHSGSGASNEADEEDGAQRRART
jgi:DivIVA domain-containing protein